MSEYTPTDEQIQEAVTHWKSTTWTRDEFDRWLLAHDAEVARKTLEDAANEISTQWERMGREWGSIHHLFVPIPSDALVYEDPSTDKKEG